MEADLIPFTITAGDKVRRDGWNFRPVAAAFWVPKFEVVSAIQAVLQSGRLKVAGKLPLAATLKREFIDFQVKVSAAANESFGAWRTGAHDDLVLALGIALWVAGRRGIDYRSTAYTEFGDNQAGLAPAINPWLGHAERPELPPPMPIDPTDPERAALAREHNAELEAARLEREAERRAATAAQAERSREWHSPSNPVWWNGMVDDE